MKPTANQWGNYLAFFGLILIFAFAGCGDEDETENNDPGQDTPPDECETDEECGDDYYCIFESCYEDEPIECDSGADCETDMPYCVDGTCYHTCEADDDCDGDDYICDQGQCIEDPAVGCQDHDDCPGEYCHDELCVSEDFICTLQDCGGQRGVCNPEAGADGDCVNADACSSLDACVEDHYCIDNQCTEIDDACADCDDGEACEFDPNTLSVECYDPDIICEPGHRECLDEDTLYICSSDGTLEQTQPCFEGCNEEELRCNQPEGESCQDPFETEDGDSFELEWVDFGNNYEPDGSEGCIDETQDLLVTSSDATFALDIGPGEVGVVELYTQFENAILYMFDDCPDVDAGEAKSCPEPTGHHVEILDDNTTMRSFWYENDGDDTETIFVVADSSDGAIDEQATVDITISEQICDAGDPVCADGKLGECSTQGTHFLTDDHRECSLGCYSDDPSDGLCEAKPHSQCDDAVDYEGDSSESFTYEIIDFHPDDEALDTNHCVNPSVDSGHSSSFEGPTAYFSATLDENERLNAKLASQFKAGLSITDGCDDGLCHVAANESENTEHAEFVASEDGQQVFVVVHAIDEDVEDGEFTLDLSIDEPLCQDHEAGDILGCIDDTMLHYCDGDDYPERFDCGGDCEDGACVEPTGDECFDTIPIESGDSHQGSFADLSSVSNPLLCDGEYFDNDPTGDDMIFELDLTETSDQLVQAELETTSPTAGLYLLDDCPVGSGTDDFSDQCVDGAVPTDELELFVEDPGTYYLVVDTSNRHDEAEFTLHLELADGECLPGAKRCAAGNVERCDEVDEGEFAYTPIQECIVDCDDDDYICTGPDDANNSCSESQTVSTSGHIVDDFARFDGLEPLQGGYCLGEEDDGTTDGPDAFYNIQLDAMQGVIVDATIDVDDSGSHDFGLYLDEDCIDSGEECRESTEFGGSGTQEDSLEYYSPNGGTYTIGLYAIDDVDSGEFSLHFEFFDGDCDPEQDNICDGDTAEQCTSLGILEEIECEYGCHNGECLDKEGDFCSRPFDIDEQGDTEDGVTSYEFNGHLGGYTDAYNPDDDGDSCTGGPGDGPDVVFAFEGWAGDEVELSLESQYDSALWVTTDCGDAAASCVDGVDDVFGPSTDNPEELSFAVDYHSTYYVIADAVQTGATGEFTFEATIDHGPQQSDPAVDVSEDELFFESRIEQSASESFDIVNDGEMTLEFDIDDGDDWLEASPSDGDVEGESSDEITVTATCPDIHGSYTETLDIDTNAPFDSQATVDVLMECWDYGALDVDITGLPEDVEHDVDVEDEDGNVVGSLDEDGNLDELEPGTYDIVPDDVDDEDGYVYEADPIEDVEIASGETVDETVEYQALPMMDVSDDAVDLEAKVDEDDSASFDIENTGDQFLEFDIDSSADWLDVDPDEATVDGGSFATVDVTGDCSGKEDGTYTETLEIDSNAASDSTADVDVTLECWDYGALDVDITGLPEDVEHDVDVEDEDGNVVGSLDEDGNLDELEPGTYDIVPDDVDDEDGYVYEADSIEDVEIASGETVDETVEYQALPMMDVSDDAVDLEAKVDEDDSAFFEIENSGDQDLEFDIDSSADWLDVDPDEAIVDGGSFATVDVTGDCSGKEDGTYTETLEIDSNAASDSTADVDVTLECWDYGALDVDVTGLPEDVEHDVDVEDEDGNVVGSLDEDGNLDELEPGTYDIVPDDVDDEDGVTYVADPIEDVEISSGETVDETVEYQEADD